MARALRTLVALSALSAFLGGGCSSCEEEECPSGLAACPDGCVDLATDARNCGACATRCPAGGSCTGGVCACPAGEVVCGGACVDPASWLTDPRNCGGCGIDCGVGTCVAGACDCGAFDACPAQVPRCVDGQNDPRNCGIGAAACGNVCPLANDVCEGGVCACPAGTTPCPVASPTACVDLQSDEANCGACGTACAAGATCDAGVCRCPAGTTPCPTAAPTACVDLGADESNCGTCGWRCPADATCDAGTCACPAEKPLTCGGGGAGGSCCAGNGCCPSSACQTQHSNGLGIAGLGQAFYDCLPLGTYDLVQAEKAARAWQPSGRAVLANELLCASQSCLGWRTPDGASPAACATWCYGGDTLRGRVILVAGLFCGCPQPGTPNWN